MKAVSIKSFSSRVIFIFILVCFTAASFAQNAITVKGFQEDIINMHSQINASSCIPSGIEMVLKLNCKVESNFYNFQQIWGNKIDGTFQNFDNLLINGLRFSHKYNLQRNNNFPFKDLYNTIDKELAEDRFVLVSLISGQNMWHIYVITEKLQNGEYKAYSKFNNETLVVSNVKEYIKNMKGTDIMVYRKE